MQVTIVPYTPPKAMSLSEFADEHGLTLEIRQYDRGWAARFEGVNEYSNGCFKSTYGCGNSQLTAVDDYVNLLAGKVITTDYDNRINVPNHFYNDWKPE